MNTASTAFGISTLRRGTVCAAVSLLLLSSCGWMLKGNSGTTAGSNFLGTTDNQALELKSNGQRVMRLEPAVTNAAKETSPNVIGGDAANAVAAGVQGGTIAGGGGLYLPSNGIPQSAPNRVEGDFGAVLGGTGNQARSQWTTVAGGASNWARGQGATVAGGMSVAADGDVATVGGGIDNAALAPFAVVPGGAFNQANGRASFAAGCGAHTTHAGAFIWSDGSLCSGQITPFNSTANNEFSARAIGGVRFVSATDATGAPTAGVRLAPGANAWSSLSDRNSKENFATVDARDLVRRLAQIPVKTWNYKTQAASIRHIGPVAQDFHAAFNVGEDDQRISTIDADGVALAAIQGLYLLLQERDAEIAQQREEIRVLRDTMAAAASEHEQINRLAARLSVLEQRGVLTQVSGR